MDLWLTLTILAAALVMLWLTTSIATLIIAHRRGGSTLFWISLALLLGPVGLFLVLRLAQSCPHCQTKVLRGIHTCPQCCRDLPRMNPDDNPVGPFWTYRRDW